MKSLYKKSTGFTLVEILLGLAVVGIIIASTMQVMKSSNNYVNKYMYYSAIKNLEIGAGEIRELGFDTNADSILESSLPTSSDANCKNVLAVDGLCTRFIKMANTIGTPQCNTTSAPALTDSTNFKSTTPNFISANGTRYFNFDSAPVGGLFTVYLDIDGLKRNAELNKDVVKFTIKTDGTVLPYINSVGANDVNYLSASVGYTDSTTEKFVMVATGLPYRKALCIANDSRVSDPTTYAAYCSPTYTVNALCATNSCEVTIERPKFAKEDIE